MEEEGKARRARERQLYTLHAIICYPILDSSRGSNTGTDRFTCCDGPRSNPRVVGVSYLPPFSPEQRKSFRFIHNNLCLACCSFSYMCLFSPHVYLFLPFPTIDSPLINLLHNASKRIMLPVLPPYGVARGCTTSRGRTEHKLVQVEQAHPAARPRSCISSAANLQRGRSAV